MHCFRQCLVIWLCLISISITFADALTPQRLALLRGTIALVEGSTSALADLEQAAQLQTEDWQSQMLYGEALARNGQSALAKGQLRRAAMIAPWRPEPWKSLIAFARSVNDSDLEYAGIAGLLRIFPEDPVLKARMAALYRAKGQTALADKLQANWQATLPPLQFTGSYTYNGHAATLVELRQLVQSQPDNSDILNALAAEEWHAGNGEGVYTILRKQLQLQPTDLTVIHNLAHICFLSARRDEALQLLRQAPTDDPVAARNLAAWSIADGNYTDALPAIRQLLQQSPNDPIANRQFGVISLLTGDLTTAVSALRIAWETQPDDLTAQQYIIALLLSGKTQEAEDVAKQAIQADPTEYMLLIVQALIYRDTDRMDKAADLISFAAGYRPENVELSILAAERYIDAGKYNRAITITQRLRDAYPSDPVAMHGTVQLFRRLCMTNDAVLTLTRYLGPSISSPLPRVETFLTITRYALDEHRLNEASSALNELLRLDPKNRAAYDLLVRIALQQQHWTDAIALLNTAKTYWPADRDIAITLARTSAQAGDLPQAIRSYREALNRDDRGEVWIELGDVYQQLGDTEQARVCWQTATKKQSGQNRAYYRLALSYLRDNDPRAADYQRTAQALDSQLHVTLTTRWQNELSTRGLAISDDEIHGLLGLSTDLLNP